MFQFMIAGDQLRPRVHRRSDHRNTRHFTFDRFEIVNGQRVGAGVAGATANAAYVLRPRANEQQVRADALDLRLNRRRRALADTHHRNHRRNADDDAEHGQSRAHLVTNKSAKRDTNDH